MMWILGRLKVKELNFFRHFSFRFFFLITTLLFFTYGCFGSPKLEYLLMRIQVDKEGNSGATFQSFVDP